MAERILVVEDDKLTARRLQTLLRQLDYDVPHTAASGEAAIELAAQDAPSLVLMDIRLKGQMDGIEATKEIRSRFDIPVVYLTAQLDEHTFRRAKATSPFGYIPKPFDERLLQTTIEIALSNHAIDRRLRDSEEQLRGVFENALDAVVTMNDAGAITEWNPQAEHTFGWTREEVLGKNLADTIIPQKFQEAHERGLAQFLATGIGPLFNRRLDQFFAVHKDGHEFPIELSISPVRLGDTYVFSAFVRDITEREEARRRLESSEEKYRTLVETTQTGYVIVDSCGRVVDANAEYVRMTGHLTRNDIMGRRITEWTAAHHQELVAEKIAECIECGVLRGFERDFLGPNGSITPVEINATVIESDQGTRILGLCRDISERRAAERALKQSNADLEDYSTAVSHDLKEPLGTVMRHMQHLLRRYREQLSDEAIEHLNTSISATKYMERLIKDLKKIFEVGRGTAHVVDSQREIEGVLRIMQPMLNEASAKVSHDSLPTVYANKTEVAQIFQNLISNAVKFSRADCDPEIEISCQPDGEDWCFAVKDNGIGIAAEHLGRIFQIFERIEEKETDGTGIGLATAKKAVERRGGRIWVESHLGEGTTFFFTLPQAKLISSER